MLQLWKGRAFWLLQLHGVLMRPFPDDALSEYEYGPSVLVRPAESWVSSVPATPWSQLPSSVTLVHNVRELEIGSLPRDTTG